ncbi:hypothetical protein SAMN04488121_108225 [Chitinophaga filiformis]|uniref:Uncharacterized protein n=1 Tax=Chitinophaga filiformis TaxID=104663 RepID=A0A1G7ZEN7_CHIFI|nr:hypothetical protein SAMN04488121_108225 [Chitinophaga filiformis]
MKAAGLIFCELFDSVNLLLDFVNQPLQEPVFCPDHA